MENILYETKLQRAHGTRVQSSHETKVRRASELKRRQEFIIKIFISVMICFTLILATVTVTQAINKKYQTIIIKKGETIWNIASKISNGKDVKSLVSEISSVNGIQADFVKSGQKIIVPVV